MNPAIGLEIAGGFDMAGTQYATKGSPGPAIRFWASGHYTTLNNGEQSQYGAETPWLSNAALDYKATNSPKTLWSLHQANWAGPALTGCPKDVPGANRTVVEISFANDKEGTTDHGGFYAIASVDLRSGDPWYDFDRIRGGNGPKGNVVPVRPIPVPEVTKAVPGKGDTLELSIRFDKPVSYSEGGVDTPAALIQGVRLMYATGDAPTSSKPDGYQPVMNPKKSGSPLGVIPAMAGEATVAVPMPAKGDKVWLVSQLVYADPATVLSTVVSGHAAGVGADGQVSPPADAAGRQRKGSRRQ